MSDYIQQDKIGLVIAKGLSVVYKERPQNPVEFFAHWLLLENEKRKQEAEEKKDEEKIQMLKDKEAYQQIAINKQREEERLEAIAEAAKKTDFIQLVERSEDLYDHLQELLEHVAEQTGATAGYIGKVVKPIRGIRDGLPEDADDEAHIIEDAKDQIQF